MKAAAENGSRRLVRLGQRKRIEQFRLGGHWPVNMRGLCKWVIFYVARAALRMYYARAVIFGLKERVIGIFPDFERAAVNGKCRNRRPIFIGKIVVFPLR